MVWFWKMKRILQGIQFKQFVGIGAGSQLLQIGRSRVQSRTQSFGWKWAEHPWSSHKLVGRGCLCGVLRLFLSWGPRMLWWGNNQLCVKAWEDIREDIVWIKMGTSIPISTCGKLGFKERKQYTKSYNAFRIS